jgi:hypothetical protein
MISRAITFKRVFSIFFFGYFLLSFLPVFGLGQVEEIVDPPDPNAPLVTYLIEAKLSPDDRELTAIETMSWRNTTQHTKDHLRFHLYYNAFRNLESTFLREAKYYKKSKKTLQRTRFGEIKINEIRRINGGDLTANTSFVSPDDNNKEDRTVMELKLEKPVEPGQTVRLKIRFTLTIPQIFARTGCKDDYYFMAQWFPKIGVLQENGEWNCHQFHKNSEFFADYGDYKVAMTAPEKFVLGATGNLVKTERNADKSITYFYEEKNIHDFAWTAYPGFTRVTDKIQLPGVSRETDIELLLSPGRGFAKQRYLNSVKAAMMFFARHIYPYPYQKITVVDPPLKGGGSGGMEYPGLITGSAMWLMPDGLRMTELVTIHEFGHEYWYGIVGTDEFREAWLDEGVTSFFELEIMDEFFKNSPSVLDSAFMDIDVLDFSRARSNSLLPIDPVNQYSWKFMNRNQYGGNVYSKAAVFLRSLRNLVGKERMYNFFKYYVDRYKFKHPTTEDFVETFNNFMNEDYSWAFDTYIRGSGGLDHAVHSISASRLWDDQGTYRSEAVFIRKEGYFPVELLITLENGKEIKTFWKEQEKWKKIIFDDPSPIAKAVIDPHYKIPLDRNYLNNSKVRKPSRSGIKRLATNIGFMFQNILAFFTF